MIKHVPNILSGFRILLVPVFIFAYFADADGIKTYAVAIYALAAVTDFLDGAIARKYNLISNLGKVLDPLGDKMMMVAAMVCITIDGILPVWAVTIVAAKEILMGIGGVVIHRRAKAEIPASNIFGKTATVVSIVACLSLMIFPIRAQQFAAFMMAIAISLMFGALATYVRTFSLVMKERKAETKTKN